MSTTTPYRAFGLTSLTCLVIANMIGAGVFTTSGFALADLGSPERVMLAWLIGGVIALCGAASYAGLIRAITESGGEYLFLSRILHPAAGFVAGWVSLLAGFTGAIAFAALAFEEYLRPLVGGRFPPGSFAIALVVIAGVLHGIRVGAGARFQNVLVFLKIILILIFIVLALIARPETPGNVVIPAPFSISVFAGALVWIALSYSGFNAAVYVAGESVDASSNAPRALLIGTVLVTVLYLAFNAVLLFIPPVETIAGRPDVAAAAAQAIGGDTAAILVRLTILLALITSVTSMTMAGPRVYAQMAEDGLMPTVLKLKHGAPRISIAMQCALAIGLILIADLRDLLSYLGFTLSLSASLTVACVYLLRRQKGANNVSVWGYPVTPALFVVASVLLALLAAAENPVEFLAAILTIGSGLAIYAVINI